MDYTTYDNKLTTDNPNDQVGRPVNVKTNYRKDMVSLMTGEGSILKETEVNAVLNNFWRRLREMTVRGEAYSEAYFSTQYSIAGVFENEDDQFDPNRHTLVLSVQLKGDILEAVKEIPLKKVDANKVIPVIDEVYDWGTKTTNETLTPGDVLEVKGDQLKLYHNVEDEEGVFFINQSDGTEVRETELRTNEPKTLTLRIPALTPGNYRIEVRNSAYRVKSLRTGVLVPTLTVS